MPAPAPPRQSDSVKNGKACSATPARATDEEIEDDLVQMRKTWDGKPYVKPASSKEVVPELDDYGYERRILQKLKSKLESNIRNEHSTEEEELVNCSQPKDEEAGVSIETSDARGELLNTNDAVNLLIPPEKLAPPKKAIPARANLRRNAARKARYAGSEKVRKTPRVGKASSIVDKSMAKSTPPAIPAEVKTLTKNTGKPAGEPEMAVKNFAVVVYTRASSDKPPTATAPEAEGPICEIITDEDKSSTSSESGDDLKTDGTYAPVASRKRAAQNKAVAPPERNLRRKAAAPEAVIAGAITTPVEIDPTLAKERVKPAAGTKRCGRRNGNAPEAKATAQKEARPPAAPDVDAALTTEEPTPAAPLGGYTKRKATGPEAATGPNIVPKVSATLAEIANTAQRWRRNVGSHTAKVVTHPDTSLKIDNTKLSAATKSRGVKRNATQLQESGEPVAASREHKKKRVDTSEVRAAVPQEAGPPAVPEVEEHTPPAAVSETPVGAVAPPATTSAPPVRVRGSRYRIPAEGSRKSTRIKAQHDKLK